VAGFSAYFNILSARLHPKFGTIGRSTDLVLDKPDKLARDKLSKLISTTINGKQKIIMKLTTGLCSSTCGHSVSCKTTFKS
jgi:hypothetical protein